MSREDSQARRRRTVISCLGALTSLALHVLLIAPLVIGFGATKNQHQVDSIGYLSSTDDGSSSDMILEVVDVSDRPEALGGEVSVPLPPMPSLKFISLPTARAPKLNFPTDDTDESHGDLSDPSTPDPGRQLLFGRYVGQIAARIERAWTRPRVPIDSAFFACRVRITQDHNGTVQEIELVRCNGNTRWQTSLVQAIQTASPLPAPPDAAVFTREIILDLQSMQFTPGSSTEGFAAY